MSFIDKNDKIFYKKYEVINLDLEKLDSTELDLEKLERRLDVIGENLKELGYDLREDLDELIEQRPDIANLIVTTKLKKIEYFQDVEQNFLGFLVGHLHITFMMEFGEDEEGSFYDVLECRVLDIDGGSDN